MKKLITFLYLFQIIVSASAQTKTIIYFDSNKSELKTVSKKAIDSIINNLKPANTYQISINGYCDNIGTDATNQQLSEERATVVANYFKEKKVSLQNVTTKGFGESMPVANNDTEKGRAENRRAEIEITATTPLNVEPIIVNSKAVIEESKDEPPLDKNKTLSLKSTAADFQIGQTLMLRKINFEGGTARLLPESKPSLELLLKTMKDNPTLEIEIGGHVCCANDMPLSVKRALAVYDFLIEHGVKESRLKYKGYSNFHIIADDDTEDGHRQNRRVEITILNK